MQRVAQRGQRGPQIAGRDPTGIELRESPGHAGLEQLGRIGVERRREIDEPTLQLRLPVGERARLVSTQELRVPFEQEARRQTGVAGRARFEDLRDELATCLHARIASPRRVTTGSRF